MPVTTNTRKLAALLGASGAGIGTDGLMQPAGIDADMATQAELDLKAPLASPAITGTPTGITAAHITSGVLPVGVTGGSGLTALGTVTATGGTIDTSVSGYKIHTFTSNGTFTVSTIGIVDVLVVAGGGGGGTSKSGAGGGGGGGAGGYLYSSSAVTARAYTITVGGAGDGASGSGATWGYNGGNSSAFGLVALGGGGGQAGANEDIPEYEVGRGHDGGSGGGGAYRGYAIRPRSGGRGIQGFDGGNITVGSGRPEGAGGGGSSAAGQNNTVSTPQGGAGTVCNITGSDVTYAAGGDGGSGTGSHATANTGNGGDGGYATGASGNGGSGIVIIRYVV